MKREVKKILQLDSSIKHANLILAHNHGLSYDHDKKIISNSYNEETGELNCQNRKLYTECINTLIPIWEKLGLEIHNTNFYNGVWHFVLSWIDKGNKHLILDWHMGETLQQAAAFATAQAVHLQINELCAIQDFESVATDYHDNYIGAIDYVETNQDGTFSIGELLLGRESLALKYNDLVDENKRLKQKLEKDDES